MDHDVFGDAADVLRSLLPPPLSGAQMRHHRWGLKVWFGDGVVTKEHYEAQIVNARYVPDATALGLEVGFHAEHPKPADNERVLEGLLAREKSWRRVLGREAIAGPFLGRDSWRRVSETWPDVDLGDPDLAVEIGTRLLDYMTAIEPIRARPHC